MRIAVYPGTFDPVTNGHLDVLKRAAKIFNQVIIAVALNEKKKPIFSRDERVELIRENISDVSNIQVKAFDGLTTAFAKSVGACAIIRGLRAVSDFEFEFQMAQMNRQIDPSIETIFLMPSQEYFYTSSNLIKEVARFHPDNVEKFVPKNVLKRLRLHYNK